MKTADVLILLAPSFAVGIWAAVRFDPNPGYILAMAAFTQVFFALFGARAGCISAFLLVMVGICLGMYAGRTNGWPDDLSDEVEIAGMVSQCQRLDDHSLVGRIRLDSETGGRLFPARTGCLEIDAWFYNDLGNCLRPGDWLRLRCSLRCPDPSRAQVPWDGAIYDAVVLRREQVLERRATPHYCWRRFGYIARNRIAENLRQGLSARIAGLYTALLLGDRRQLDDDVNGMFRKAGLAHLIAISGLHLGIIVMIIGVVVGFLIADYRFRSVMSISILIGYAILVQSRASLSRALIMVCIMLSAPLLGRRAGWLHGLSLTFLLMLMFNPPSLYDVGFQLSFTAVFGILVYTNRLADQIRLPWLRIRRLLGVTLAAQLWISPLTSYHFQQIAPFTIILYPIVLPIFFITILTGFCCLPLLLASGDWALSAAPLLETVASWLLKMISLAADLKVFAIPFGPPHMTTMAACYLTLLCTLWTNRFRSLLGLQAILVIAMFGIELSGEIAPNIPSSYLEIRHMDVGNGDAALLRFPSGQRMIIDGGGKPFGIIDQEQERLLRHLRSARIRHIDYLVVSHSDADHIKGAIRVLEELSVGEVWYALTPNKLLDRLVILAMEHGVRRRILSRPFVTSLPTDSNNRSLILAVRYNRFQALFTGDISQPIEALLAAEQGQLGSYLLKVPHHGSNTSSSTAFLRLVAPRLAVISAGRRNRFGHPSPSTLDRLSQIPARPEILRTDAHGDLLIRTDGYVLHFHSCDR
ncbi:DNA internalization-related competence protein ComEC/Rec2 [bacterium]|nr:DNA internalization-related competence protein ComEC/Rec2 [candidate division CSSED10-310 bacterium]